MKNIVIIGGGFIGLAAYKIFKSINKNFNVKIIDNQKQLGGFLNSIKVGNNYFDIGTHFLKETGIKSLDKILFSEIKKKWINLDFLNSGSYYKKKNEYNQFVNLKEVENQKKIIDQIITNKRKKNNLNEQERCESTYGKILTKKVIEPKIYKYVEKKLKFLPSGFSTKFALGRYNLDDEKLISKLKKNKKFDKIFSFKFNYQKTEFLKSFYPKKGGIGGFKNFFINLKSKDIFLETKIREIKIDNKKINKIITNKKIFSPDYVIWTIDEKLFNNLCLNNEITLKRLNQSKIINEKSFHWNFVNIVSNNKFNTKCYYINVHHPKMNLYRVTLYKNIQKLGTNRATLEFLSKEKKYLSIDSILTDLKKINLIKKNDNIKICNQFSIKMKIPEIIKTKQRKIKIKNISFLKSGLFDIKNQEQKLIDLYANIKKILKHEKKKSN